uniref:uncharacterized protein LOC120346287 n=1 Tax=Styela clava TaxID=7725 RepID=UPI00193951AA|nr:uncharacterized protein LOC120346287 [Styela clava]
MKISITFILIYVIAPSWCQDETVFHCSPKPGCQIAQCDPVAVRWDRPGFNIDKQLHDKEFPITCKSENAAKPQNTGNLFPLVSRNILDIGHIKSDLRELEEGFENKLKNIGSPGNDESGDKIEEQSTEINNLKRRVEQQSDEMKKLKEEFEELWAINSKLLEKQSKTAQQSTEIKELKKEISRIERRLVVMDKPHQLPDSGQITKPTTKTRTTLKPTSASENCKLKVGKICYFAVIHDEWDVNYDKAVDICKKRNAYVGLIEDKEFYNAIMKYLRKEIPKGEVWINIWTGIHFDPMTGAFSPIDSFIEWRSGSYPKTGIKYKDHTIVYLEVRSNPNYFQGMVNEYPTRKLNGVICEIQI